jgi:DNA-binding GntR family transcriptional regulator
MFEGSVMAKNRRSDSNSDVVYKAILRGLQDGTYPPGSLMPHGTTFAAEHQVGVGTVKSVMWDLIEEGWLIPRGPGKPHRVHPIPPTSNQEPPTT